MPARPIPLLCRSRTPLLAALIAAGACGGEARTPAPAAVVGPDTLSAEVLSNWMVLGQPLPVSLEVAEGLARHWAEVSALALLGPGLLREREFVDAVIWPRVQSTVLDSVLSRRLGRPDPPDPAEVDSIFREGRLRMVARVLRRASPEAHPEERQRQRDEALGIRRNLIQGASWNEAVSRSEDEATRSVGGLMGLIGPGELDPGLDGAAYALEPGAISPVVETREGYQILFRPRLEDVRTPFAEGLRDRRAAQERGAFLDSTVLDYAPVLGEAAGARLLEWAGGSAPDGSSPPIARWDGGELSDTAVARFLGTLAPVDRERLLAGPEQEAAELVLEIARQEILWRRLAPRDDPDVRRWESRAATAARGDWLTTVDLVQTALELGKDNGPDARGRGVEAYMEAVVSRRRAPVVIPSPAAGRATMASDVRLEAEGLEAAVQRGVRLLEGAEGRLP